jgi:hypothetical protein
MAAAAGRQLWPDGTKGHTSRQSVGKILNMLLMETAPRASALLHRIYNWKTSLDTNEPNNGTYQ